MNGPMTFKIYSWIYWFFIQEEEWHVFKAITKEDESACVVKVWGVVPTSLVEAERNGANFVQRLTKMDASDSSSSSTAVTDPTNSDKKKANGHKEEG